MSTKLIRYCCIFLILLSCNRSELLDSTTSSNLETISSTEDIQLLLSNRFIYEWESNISVLITDEIMFDAVLAGQLNSRDRSFYYWKDNFIRETDVFEDWNNYYNKILTANAIIDFYSKSGALSSTDRYFLSIAYFIRSKANFELMILHCSADPANNVKPGIPIRISSSIDENISQRSLKASFELIDNDLQKALQLSADTEEILISAIPVKRNWMLAFASRFYLYVGNYQKSLQFSQLLLSQPQAQLINYNLYTNQNTRVFLQSDIIGNIIYNSLETDLLNLMINPAIYTNNELMNSYTVYDKRKSLFFNQRNGTYFYKNPYLNNIFSFFTGFTYSEIYLNRLECELQLSPADNYPTLANDWINHRYAQNDFTDEYINSFQFIIDERKKELVMRGMALADLKRYYEKGITLKIKKILDQSEVYLTAGDPEINILYPNSVIKNYNIQQVR